MILWLRRKSLKKVTYAGYNFSYICDDVIAFFSNKSIRNLVIINPDNPSGNYLCHADVLRLFDWASSRDIRLIYDESF